MSNFCEIGKISVLLSIFNTSNLILKTAFKLLLQIQNDAKTKNSNNRVMNCQ